jgi:F-type H+-transporting ATPase subunit gamma
MPSLIDIRRRIRSVKNTQQITKAMKMVAAAKLRRAQDRVIASRPYSRLLERVLANIAAAAASSATDTHPLLVRRPEERILLVLITGDRGLVGAFNTNIIKHAQKFLGEHSSQAVELELLGRKGRDFFRRRPVKIAAEHVALFLRAPEQAKAEDIASGIIGRFTNAEIDAVYIMGNRFKSVLSPELSTRRILPADLPASQSAIDYIYEQPPEQLLTGLLPAYVKNQIYLAMIESFASEQAAQMTAMEAASSNAADVLDSLTLKMNRIRQASITREIIEIVSGAAALG